MTQCVDADLSSRKCRERELYSIPISSSWFKWDEIHESERRSLPEFFDGGSYSRSPRVYKEYRDFIINKYREDPSRRLTFTDVRKCLVGDVGTLRKVFLFLEKWGLINFSVSDGQQRSEEDGGLVVLVEVGPAAGVRVVPPLPSSSSSSFADTAQAGGESGFRLPPLSSYSDAFGEWKPGSGLICGFCGGLYHSGLNESLNGGITMCTKCLTNETMNENTELHLIPNVHPDVKDQSSHVWTDAETLLLLEAALKHGDDWDLIAQHVRTKNKFDCISRLIHLPFGDHRLGTISTKSSNTNLITPLEEYKSSLPVLNGNPPPFTEIDGDQQVEINKTKGAEIASQGHPLKRRCFSPFIDTTDSFMKQVASLSVVGGSHVAAVAVDAAIRALCLENPSARLAFETNGDQIAKPVSSPYQNEFKSDIKVEDGDAKRNKQSAYVPEKSFGATTFQVRAAIATSLAAAAARAKLVADQEEREMELLMASIIQAQVKKLQYKMKHLKEMELIMEKEYSYVQEMKELEKLGPKKGVISQSVKDVVQSLVDDDLVLKDKIGTSVYFWSLPSCAGNQLSNAHNKLESDLLSRRKHLAELDEQRLSLKRGREESDDREMASEELKAIELQHNKLKEELALFADNDPAAVEAMKNAKDIAHSAANRWTDNIFTLQHWCSSNFPEAKEQLEHMYKEVGITEDLDYL